jgi:hypothetical protein
VYNGFKKIPHLTVYKQEDIPQTYHYSKNWRILPIIAVADEGWTLSQLGNPFEHQNRTKGE